MINQEKRDRVTSAYQTEICSMFECIGSSKGATAYGFGTTGSHVPHESLSQVHAAAMPDAVQSVNRFPMNVSHFAL